MNEHSFLVEDQKFVAPIRCSECDDKRVTRANLAGSAPCCTGGPDARAYQPNGTKAPTFQAALSAWKQLLKDMSAALEST